ncbi:MAG: DUF6140 family protein [Bacteroidales bacterium]|nr:DUF6140 family protein [Bacteroidales bacterium]
MALWKISVKRKVNKVGLRLEEGMFVELVAPTTTNPLAQSKYIPQIRQLFESKYGIDPEQYANTGYMESEKLS